MTAIFAERPPAAQLRPVELKNKSQWIAPIAGLRGSAALAVVLAHDAIISRLLGTYQIGPAAVGVFFSISGFLAYYVLRRDEARLGRVNYSYFLWRRILRIWPAYFAAIAGIIAITEYWGDPHTYVVELWPLFTFTSNSGLALWQTSGPPPWMGPWWSIAVEEQFYLIAPLMYFAIRSRYSAVFCACVVLFANIARMLYIAFSPGLPGANGGLYYFAFSHIDTFVAGAMVAHFYDKRSFDWLKAHHQAILFALGVSLLAIVAKLWGLWIWPPYSPIFNVPYVIMPLAGAAILISLLPVASWPMAAVLGSAPLRALGALSYSIYLIHLFVLDHFVVLPWTDWQPPVRYISGGLWLLALAMASYFFVERPFLRLKNRRPEHEFRWNWPVVLIAGLIGLGFARFAWRVATS